MISTQKATGRYWTGLPGLVTGLLLLLLGGLILGGTIQLRQKIRAQSIRRDGEILHAVALMQQIAGESSEDLGGEIENFVDQFNLALQISQLNQGVVGTRLYDREGQFRTAFPAYVRAAPLQPGDLAELLRLRPVSRFHPDLSLEDVIGSESAGSSRAPFLEVEIPLHRQREGQLLGVVQFIIDGEDIAREFTALNRHLAWQAGTTFVAGALLIVAVLGWAFGRLERSARLLLDRTVRLQQANEKLVDTAKSSAIGAVTAHLIHGLSSPLAGLKDLLTGGPPNNAGDWETAAETTRRMEALVRDLVSFIGEEQSQLYQVSVTELLQSLRLRQTPAAEAARVFLEVSQEVDAVLDNREANLVLLILDQLLENAFEATPAGKRVQVRVADRPGESAAFLVYDDGPGFPAHLRERIFSPCRSTKPTGHGVGLAIGKHLADHLGATLELDQTSDSGCRFALTLPRVDKKSRLMHSLRPSDSRGRIPR